MGCVSASRSLLVRVVTTIDSAVVKTALVRLIVIVVERTALLSAKRICLSH